MNTTLHTRLECLIATLGMRSRDFAERIGFSQSYISMILNGKKTNPSQRFFDAVAREFNANAEWLRDNAGEMFLFPNLDISAADSSLLAKYRMLPLPERKIVDEIVDAMLLKSMAQHDSPSS